MNIDVAVAKLSDLARDIEQLKIDPPYRLLSNDAVIPTNQRQGFMQKLGHNRKKWFKRFFVLRDSFLLCYNLQKSTLTVAPSLALHIANCKIAETEHGSKPCFSITTAEKDNYLFACANVDERKAWLKDIQIGRTITHVNMVKVNIENQCLAEEKGLSPAQREQYNASLAIFSNEAYVKSTPLVGGAEGWLYTPGMNETVGDKTKWAKAYFILRDSHLLMFKGGDLVTKPRGCMYLVGTDTSKIEQDNLTKDGKPLFAYQCEATECGDFVALASMSEEYRQRWMQALTVGSRVTYRDIKLLLKEHEVLNKIEDGKTEVNPIKIDEDDTDLQGNQLDPAQVQAYTKDGAPIFRNPDGDLVDSSTGGVVPATEPRFCANGQQLDPFNRPLPEGAVPMFTKEMEPVGVGPDGKNYTADGAEVPEGGEIKGADGKQLDNEAVAKAAEVAKTVKVAIKVRSKMQSNTAAPEAVDMLGRTFRNMNEDESGNVINQDGKKVPIKTARVMESTGALLDYKTHRQAVSQTYRDQGETPLEERSATVKILEQEVDESSEPKSLGSLEITGEDTLLDVRNQIKEELKTSDEFVLSSTFCPFPSTRRHQGWRSCSAIAS